jgi:hypothetical protein
MALPQPGHQIRKPTFSAGHCSIFWQYKAAFQVLQDRKVPMTCPEMIDVMAIEGSWTSPGGKTPAATLYAALSRSIEDFGKSSAFRKAERGKFEAKILPKE